MHSSLFPSYVVYSDSVIQIHFTNVKPQKSQWNEDSTKQIITEEYLLYITQAGGT